MLVRLHRHQLPQGLRPLTLYPSLLCPPASISFSHFLVRISSYFLLLLSISAPFSSTFFSLFSYSAFLSFFLPLIHPFSHPSLFTVLAIRLMTGETSVAPSAVNLRCKGQSKYSCSRGACGSKPPSTRLTSHHPSLSDTEGEEEGHSFLYEVIAALQRPTRRQFMPSTVCKILAPFLFQLH